MLAMLLMLGCAESGTSGSEIGYAESVRIVERVVPCEDTYEAQAIPLPQGAMNSIYTLEYCPADSNCSRVLTTITEANYLTWGESCLFGSELRLRWVELD